MLCLCLEDMGGSDGASALRYFIAVAEEGSLTNAAERLLHTAQPSLSRQIRDLELEIGVKLLERMARGIALTAAGLSRSRAAGAAAGRSGLKPLVAPNSPRSQCLQSAFSQDRRSYGCQTRCASCGRKPRISNSRSPVSPHPSSPLR